MWTEGSAVRALLKHVGLDEEIKTHYMSDLDRVKLTDEEIKELAFASA